MDRGSLLGAWIAGFAIWAIALLAIWTMADPVAPGDLTEALMAPATEDAVRDNQRYIEQGLLKGMTISLDALQPASAATLTGQHLPGGGL